MDAATQTAKALGAKACSDLNLRTVHIPNLGHTAHGRGGVTIVYTAPEKGQRIIRAAVALCNKKDVYNKALGRYHAATEFSCGRHTNFRVPKHLHPSKFLRQMFMNMACDGELW